MKKKKFVVIPREGGAVLNGIQTSRGHRQFNGKTYMHISDPSEAREIDQKYGKTGTQDVYIAEDEQYARALNGEKWEIKSSLKGDNVKLLHNYTFAQMGANLPDRVKLIGTKKTVNGVMYMYTMRDNKLKLVPYEKRRKRANGREVTNGLDTQ